MGERHVGVALDFSPTSKYALEWALKNLVRDGDHLVLLLVHPKTNEQGQHWDENGSPLIPFVEFREAKVLQDYGVKEDAEVFDMLDSISRQKKLVIVAKIYRGDAREKLCDAVTQLSLDCLVMGSRGLGLIKRALLGSVSSYLVTHAACPVTVVKLPQEPSPPRTE